MLTWMDELFSSFGELLKTVLPRSPFTDIIMSMGNLPGLGWLNWFFPVGACLRILSAWLVAYAGYLAYSIILRWIKAVE